MTFIEFFDEVSVENVGACLSYLPQRVILLGDSSSRMSRYIGYYEKLFADHKIEFLQRAVSKSNLQHAVKVLTELVETYDDCVFDITGGSEVLNLALGIVYARHPDRKIGIQRINLRNQSVYDCDKDGLTYFEKKPCLSVQDNIRIYGGDILFGEVEETDKTYRWDMNEEFLRDIGQIWEICRVNVRNWNVQIGILAAIEKVGAEAGLKTVAKLASVEAYLARKQYEYRFYKRIIGDLLRHGLLTCFEDNGDTVTVGYKDPQIKRSLTVAGQALEMKVYSVTRAIRDQEGALAYQDALNGVLIDWDGEFHDDQVEGIFDTENEIDVLLMHGIVPIFISCKNGSVGPEELYKLETVAERFGGPYARKVLIATSLDRKGDADEYFRRRAIDMDICLIEDLHKMDDEEMRSALGSLWKNQAESKKR